ncbi:ribonuclease HII [Candidatus Woesearchaeota archaeon]|nr:ribonuclease HII [Candidatus Woesearchaeota archaeon]
MVLVSGIDESGRGPVIGPLVMAGISVKEENIKKLEDIGVKDSKLLTKQKREELFKKILGLAENYRIISLTPDVIDSVLKDPKTNLNILEAQTSSKIINHLLPDKVFIDLPDKNAERYCGYIKKDLDKQDIELIAEHKADLNYVVVGAASILAKVTRDRYVEHLRNQFREDFGSGYMSDPKTQEFLEKYWNKKEVYFFRREWASWKNKKKEKEQKRLSEFQN